MDLLLLLRETGSSHLGVLHLVLLKLEITSHVVNLSHRWQLVLPSHGLLHVLEELGNERLTVLDLLFVLGLLVVEFERELVDFLLLLVEDLVFLFLALVASLAVLLQVVVDLLDVLRVLFDHFPHLKQVLVHLFQLSVILLDPVLEALSSLWQRQVHLIGLQFQILLSLHQLGSLILEMLCSLLQGILSQPRLGLDQPGVDFFQLISGVIDFLGQHVVLLLELFVLVSLLWVEIVEASLVLEVDVLDLLLVGMDLRLKVPLITEEVVQVSTLLVILVLDMEVKILDILWLGVASVFVKGQVIIGELSLVLSHILD